MFRTGDQIGSYFLVQKLGKGAFGVVWLAEERTAISNHKVALKLPNEEDIDLEAIRQEARVWEDVKGHPNILPIIKADNIDGQIYIASEYAPDGSLSKWLKNHGGKAPTTDIAVKMIQGILSGLEHLHSKGVIHRDLKPDNILLQSDTPRIADFGIARLIQSTSNSTQATGTPSYMAPECFYATRSVQTDIWAVGVIFHLLLTGNLPFPQPDQISVMNAILNGEPQIQSNIRAKLQQVINKALQKDPIRRYQSATEMRGDLSGFSSESFADEEIILQPTVRVQPYSNKEEETLVNIGFQKKQAQSIESKPFGIWKMAVIGVGLLLILATIGVWANLQFTGKGNVSENLTNTNSPIQIQTDINGQPIQPINPVEGNGRDMVDTDSNTSIPSSAALPGDNHNPWLRDTNLSEDTPSTYIPPSEQGYTIDPNSPSQFMPQDGVVMVPVPVPANTNTNTQATPATTPKNANTPVNAQPQTTPSNTQQKPTPTPAPKTDKSPVKPTEQPKTNKPAATEKQVQSDKKQDTN